MPTRKTGGRHAEFGLPPIHTLPPIPAAGPSARGAGLSLGDACDMSPPTRTAASGGDASAHLLMVFAVSIFGLNYVVGRWAAGEVPSYTLGFTRWTMGALILLPFAWAQLKRERDEVVRNIRLLALAGFLMPFMGAGVAYVALTYTTAINAGVIQISLPVMVVILSFFFLGERTGRIQWLGAAAAIFGVLYMIARGKLSVLLGLEFNVGDAIMVACNLGLAGYGIAVKRLPYKFHPLTLLVMVCAVGSLCHLPFFAWEVATGHLPNPGPTAVVSLLFVAIFPSVIAILCWNFAIARLGPTRAGFYLYLTPVFAAAFAIPLLGESIGLYHVIGAALIVVGVTVSTRKPKA